MSKIEIEFRELLEGILYTPLEIDAMTDTQLRVIYEGIEASYTERAWRLSGLWGPAVWRLHTLEDRWANGLPKNDNGHGGAQKYQQQQVQAVLWPGPIYPGHKYNWLGPCLST